MPKTTSSALAAQEDELAAALAHVPTHGPARPAPGPRKRMTVKEFRELGYLQELNRQFLHPLGLALEVVIDEAGEMTFGGVWDCRDEQQGVVFADMTSDEARARARHVAAEMNRLSRGRARAFGWLIQPVGEDPKWKA